MFKLYPNGRRIDMLLIALFLSFYAVIPAYSSDSSEYNNCLESSAAFMHDNCCADLSKPKKLTFKYTGKSCSATDHQQSSSKVKCDGDPNDESTVRIVVSEKYNASGKIWFDGMVSLNGMFTADASNAGSTSLTSTTYVTIYKSNGWVIQKLEFHTSCSEPLAIGNQFGSLKLVGMVDKNGLDCGSSDDTDICAERDVTDNKLCNDSKDYSFFATGLISGLSNVSNYYKVENGKLTEFEDGTASFTGTFVNISNSKAKFEASITFSGRTMTAPAGSPKTDLCYNGNGNGFYYYTTTEGMLVGKSDLEGGKIKVSREGPAFQLGIGANLNEVNKFGASGWLKMVVWTQPDKSWIKFSGGNGTDINWRLSGNPDDCKPSTEVTFQCLDDIEVTASGQSGKIVTWTAPTATTTCVINDQPNCASVPTNISGTIYMGEFNGSKYYCSNGDNFTWSEAKAIAQQKGGHLVVINSAQENEFIRSKIIADYAWIGLNDDAQEGNFVWVNGAPLNYTNWSAGEPSGGSENFVRILKSDGKWTDRDKYFKAEFVIEIPCPGSGQRPGTVTVQQIEGPASGSTFPVGMTSVKYLATDECGNRDTCKFKVTVKPPPCDISLTISNKKCHDNGTPSNPSDDTYTFDLKVTGTGTSGTWTGSFDNAFLGAFAIGNTPYNTTVPLGPFPVGYDINVYVSDSGDSSCKDSEVVTSTTSCSNQPCDIQLHVLNYRCEDGGTPANPGDDRIYFEIKVTGTGTSGTWKGRYQHSAFDYPIGPTPYNTTIQIGPLLPNNFIDIQVYDSQDVNCKDSQRLPVILHCSYEFPCDIDLQVSNKQCQDNGTPADASDDTYTFDIKVTAVQGTSGRWSGSFDNAFLGAFAIGPTPYNTTINMGPFPVGYDINVHVRDTLISTCSESTVVTSTASCSGGSGNKIGDYVWNDLDSDGVQDANEPGIQGVWVILEDCNGNFVNYAITDNAGLYRFSNLTPGNYRVRFANPGGYFITSQNSGGDDAKDSDADFLGISHCITVGPNTMDLTIDCGFTSMSPPVCDINGNASDVICDDNGTPNDPTDDTFTFKLIVNGTNYGGWGWDVLGTNIVMKPYGQVVTMGPYPISGGKVTLSIRDHDIMDCFTSVEVTPPAPCSDGGDPCAGQGGDDDGDGVCGNSDCDDNNPNIPTSPGTPCNDGNPNTSNDVIQSDGCSCAGTPSGGNCDIVVTGNNGIIHISGLNAAHVNGQVFDGNWNIIYQCQGNCPNPTVLNNLAPGTYYINFQGFNASWSEICAYRDYITVTGGDPCAGQSDDDGDGVCSNSDCDDNNPNIPTTPGTPCNDGNSDTYNDVIQSDGCSCAGTPNPCAGLWDDDQDGVCSDEDCDDSNPNIPTTPGSPCNDGNPNTSNDVIQADGCSCAGTPSSDNCDIVVTTAPGKITISGLDAAYVNGQVFDGNWNLIYQCQLDCTNPTVIDNIPSGSYYINFQGFNANWNEICAYRDYADVPGGDPCFISADVSDILCNNNGTPHDPADDTYTFKIAVFRTGGCTSTSWSGGGKTGPYNTPVTFGPYPISGGNKVIQITNAEGASQTVTAIAPAPCSTPVVCDNVTDGGKIGGDESKCGPYDPSPITNITLPSGGSGDIEYMWLSSTSGCPNNLNQSIHGATGPTYDPGQITVTTWYVRCSRRKGCTDWTIGESNCVKKEVTTCQTICADRTVTDNKLCNNSTYYSFWSAGIVSGLSNVSNYYKVENGKLVENTDGTAVFTGRFVNASNGNVKFDAEITFSGRTTTPPSGSPRRDLCYSGNGNGFYYYTDISGTLTGAGSVSGGKLKIQRRGEAFQVGVGANLNETDKFGASGWLKLTVLSHPSASGVSFSGNGDADLNWRLSGSATECVDPGTQCNKKVLFVVGNAWSPGYGDDDVKDRLESLGFTVILKDDDDVSTSDADNKGLVIVSSSVSSPKVGSKFRDINVPVLSWEAWILDDMKMTGSSSSEYGSDGSHKEIDITNAGHPLAAGYSNSVKVYSSSRNVSWGSPSSNAIKVAKVQSGKYAIFAYDTGDQMVGKNAPARRVGFFLDNYTSGELTTEGWKLFDAAVFWASNCHSNSGSRVARLDLTAYPSQGQVELAWVNNTGYKNEKFIVERSADGSNFEPIFERQSEGSSDADQLYDDIDPTPITGSNFYRVKLLFNDGTLEYSNVKRVHISDLERFGLYPNPAEDYVDVALKGYEGLDLTIQVMNQFGVVVNELVVEKADNTSYRLPLSGFTNGIYSIWIFTDNKKPVGKKLVVQRPY